MTTTNVSAAGGLRPKQERYNAAGVELAKCEQDLASALSVRAQALVNGEATTAIDKERKSLESRIEDLKMLRAGLQPLLPAEERDALQAELDAALERSRQYTEEQVEPARQRLTAAESAYREAAAHYEQVKAKDGSHGSFEAGWKIRKHREAHPDLYEVQS